MQQILYLFHEGHGVDFSLFEYVLVVLYLTKTSAWIKRKEEKRREKEKEKIV